MSKLSLRGTFRIRQIRNGKIIRDFKTKNSLTIRGAIHFLASFNNTTATAAQGNPVQDSEPTLTGGPLLSLRLIDVDGDPLLQPLDAIEYRDGAGVEVQADNRAWNQIGSAGPGFIVWDDVPSKGDTSAEANAEFVADFDFQAKGVWLLYERRYALGLLNCVAVISSALFFNVLNVDKDDIVKTTYTLDILASVE